jgi:F-type H+-transporting ATPase subunit beta
VNIEAGLDGCEKILDDAFADLSEKALYMIGGIEEVQRDAD